MFHAMSSEEEHSITQESDLSGQESQQGGSLTGIVDQLGRLADLVEQLLEAMLQEEEATPAVLAPQ